MVHFDFEFTSLLLSFGFVCDRVPRAEARGYPYSTAPQPIAASGGNDALFATRTSQRIQHITLSGQRPPLEKLFEPLF
jgi:hypothetical protein